MTDDADRIVDLYERHAQRWDRERPRNLFERLWLDRFLNLLPKAGSILDIGCGAGEPISRYLIEAGYRLTGIDSSPALIALAQSRFPDRTWLVVDMRQLSLEQRFDGILAWDSFFHLRREDQRRMFAIFGRHAAAKAALMFTSGPNDTEAIGTYRGEALYHASLAAEEYRSLLGHHGFAVRSHVVEDPAAGGRTIWLAQRER